MDLFYSIVGFFVTGGPFMYPILIVFAVGAAVAIERYVTLWNPYGDEVGRLGPGNATVQDLAVNDARNQLLTITRDEICTVWDLTSGKCIQTIDPFYIPSAVSSAAHASSFAAVPCTISALQSSTCARSRSSRATASS